MSGVSLLGLPEVRALFLDIDGTLLVDDRALPGAAETLLRLRGLGLTLRFLTNTSRRGCASTARALSATGIEAVPEEVVTPSLLARRLILGSGRPAAALFVTEDARADFADVVLDERQPAWVVLGDLGAGFSYDTLNAAFRLVGGGATLVALHRNRSWRPPGGLESLDVGAFIAALEYASGKSALLVGKPSAEFFRLALHETGVPASEVLVVGDDPEADAAGARASGCRSVLVRTGKFKGLAGDQAAMPADRVIQQISDLR